MSKNCFSRTFVDFYSHKISSLFLRLIKVLMICASNRWDRGLFWQWAVEICLGCLYKTLAKVNKSSSFHAQFSPEYKIWERVAGLSPMGIRVAVGKSFV